MKIKLDNDGHAVLVDGKVVMVYDDGKELPFDAAQTVATISRINNEAKGHREKAEKLAEALKGYDGIDPSAARKALETVSNLDAKRLIDAGEVEKVKASMAQTYDERVEAIKKQFEPIIAERDQFKSNYISEKIGTAFSRSKYVEDKLAIPSDMVQLAFGRHFRVEENGEIKGYDQRGNRLISKARPGEDPSFDEALELLVDGYPNRDRIMKGSGMSGSGAGGSGGSALGSKAMTRSQFDALSHPARSSFMKSGGKVVQD